ncbi:MAG: PepSY domain-containing protein [Ferruginibacter sp.]
MTISIWRYSHLVLAITSFLFIALASVTGIILAFEPIAQKVEHYNSNDLSKIKVSDAITNIKANYNNVSSLKVDDNDFVIVSAINDNGGNVENYVDAISGKQLGVVKTQSEFFQWITNLHRSLFMQSTGRFIILLTSILLTLIAISGSILIIKRQRGLTRFFTKIVKDNFAQYYHVVLGRLSLLIIIIIAVSGIILSLGKFGIIKEFKAVNNINLDLLKASPQKDISEFPIFKSINLSEVKFIEFPFSEDVEDYFTLKLKDRELTVNQITGDILTNYQYNLSNIIMSVSMNLHTGRTNIIWAIVLGIACINILFFIYSGFKITLKRRGGIIKNKFKSSESSIIILVGSENGTTMTFANEVHKQLIKVGQKSFITELNNYKVYPQAKQLLIITATYGLGDPPENSKNFYDLINKHQQAQQVQFSVLGFGSHAYKDFCKFAFEVNNLLVEQPWAVPLMDVHTVNDRSTNDFSNWLKQWSQKVDIPIVVDHNNLVKKQIKLKQFIVTDKKFSYDVDGSFIISLKPTERIKYNSGDLLSIFPLNNYQERQYSIGKIDGHIQLSVKLHSNGIGSGFLHNLQKGEYLNAKVISNSHFHFPAQAKKIIMISNGTGIAPFLGMIHGNLKGAEIELYCGFRTSASYNLYADELKDSLENNKLHNLYLAFSREGVKTYVSDLLKANSNNIVKELEDKTFIMICGSLSMQKDIIELLESACLSKDSKSLSYYQARGQVLMDCY